MSRKPTIYSNQSPYHVVARSNNKDWFDLPMDYCYDSFFLISHKTQEMFGWRPHAFVLMGNHFHLLVTTPNDDIGKCMRYFMTESSRLLRKRSLRVNHVYGGRNRSCVIRTSEYFAHCLKYVYRNPVKAGICSDVTNYPWSTISKKIHPFKDLIDSPCEAYLDFIPEEKGDLINWLNEPTPREIEYVSSRAIKKSEFKFGKDRKTRRAVGLRTGLLQRVTKK